MPRAMDMEHLDKTVSLIAKRDGIDKVSTHNLFISLERPSPNWHCFPTDTT